MVNTTDGFEIAEADLKMRGPGDLMERNKAVAVHLKITNLSRDGEMLTLPEEWQKR